MGPSYPIRSYFVEKPLPLQDSEEEILCDSEPSGDTIDTSISSKANVITYSSLFGPSAIRPPLSLRRMKATRDNAVCLYCSNQVEKGSEIMGHYGVKWGHTSCVSQAYHSYSLISSTCNETRRPVGLKARLRRSEKIREIERSKERLQWQEVSFKSGAMKSFVEKMHSLMFPLTVIKPLDLPPSEIIHRLDYKYLEDRVMQSLCPELVPASCSYFRPQLIGPVDLPRDMALNPSMLKEVKDGKITASEQIRLMWEQVWEKYLQKWLADYKRTRSLPFCPVHQYSHDPKDHLQIHVAAMSDISRYLWWYCPAGAVDKSDIADSFRKAAVADVIVAIGIGESDESLGRR